MRTACLVTVIAALVVAIHATDLGRVAKSIEEFRAMQGPADFDIPVLEAATVKKMPLNIDASPFNEPTDLETTVRYLSEVFRVAMKKGREDLNIAALDPTVFSKLSIHFHKWFLDGQVVATDLQVSGVSDFKLTKVSARDNTTVAIEYTIPSISAVAKYALDAKVNLGVTKIHSVRNGSLEMVAGGIKGAATAKLIVDTDGQLRLTAFQVDSWSYRTFSIDMKNPSSTGFIQRIINKLIGKLVPGLLVQPHIQDLTAYASSRGFSVLSRFLDGVAGRFTIAGLDVMAAAALEDLQALMKTGNNDLDLPVLDPFSIDTIPFSFEGDHIRASIDAKNFKVNGTSAFTIHQVSQIPDSNRIRIDLEVTEITGSGHFEGTADVTYWPPYTTDVEGTLNAVLKGLDISATARLAETPEGSLLLEELKIEFWTYDEVSATFANLVNYNIENLLNSAISANGQLPMVISAQRDYINSWAEVTAKSVLDKYLAGVARASSSVAVDIKVIPAEARQIIMQLAALAA